MSGQLLFTRRALEQLREIRSASVEKHGEKVAQSYMQKIEDVLMMLVEYPHLLQERAYADYLRFYPAALHMLVCTVIDEDMYVLAVHYGSSDIEGLMRRLEHTLLQEAKILHHKVTQRDKA